MSDLERAVGPALRHLRLHGGPEPRKQLEIAAAAGVTRGMLSSYERGRQSPSLKNLGRILDALGADLASLQWAVRVVEAQPRGADAGAERATGYPRELAPEPFEIREPPTAYRAVPLPEPLTQHEERALGQMIAGFLAYLSYTRTEPTGRTTDGGPSPG